jgi:hypothetical protein
MFDHAAALWLELRMPRNDDDDDDRQAGRGMRHVSHL